jgi:hypothetical protein
MSVTTHANERPSVARRLALWWQDWRARRRTMAELGRCAREDVERMAHDVGVDRAVLRVLAGKWPGSADLLSRRMDELELDPATQVEPAVVRDLQRVCSLCVSKRKCSHDLASHSSDPAWREYCPNVETLDALIAGRANRGGTRAA